MSEALETEVAVIGAGVAGALVADRLAGSARVTLVEAGPRIDRFAALETFWRAPVKDPESPYPGGPDYPHPRSHRPDDWYVQSGPEPFRSTYLRAVGGTTWHWLGTTLRFLPDDFRLKSLYGRGEDWPLDYAALEPWYAEAERALGVAGDGQEDLGSPRSGPYPLPPIPQSYLDGRLAAGLAGTAYAAVRATPQARNSVAHRGRPECCGSGNCVPICPVGAKYDATLHVEAAEAKGARLLESAVVVRLEADGAGRIAAALIRRVDGSALRLTAKTFVLAAHGIESPRLLLNSADAAYPRGLANRSDQVGRNLMDHPVQLSWALAAEPLWPFRGPQSTSGIETFRGGAFRKERPAFRIEIGNDGWAWPEGAPLSTARRLAGAGLTGRALQRALFERTSRQLRIDSLIEQLPDPENRVTLDPALQDRYGVPRPRLAFRLGDYERRGLAEARRIHAEIFGHLGASEVAHRDRFEGGGHIMGTLRMGRDPESSVVDRELRAHDHPNLFCLGSAVFPTGATANPTLTIAALSLRAAPAIGRSLAQ